MQRYDSSLPEEKKRLDDLHSVWVERINQNINSLKANQKDYKQWQRESIAMFLQSIEKARARILQEENAISEPQKDELIKIVDDAKSKADGLLQHLNSEGWFNKFDDHYKKSSEALI